MTFMIYVIQQLKTDRELLILRFHTSMWLQNIVYEKEHTCIGPVAQVKFAKFW
jgi:hypothetical protein